MRGKSLVLLVPLILTYGVILAVFSRTGFPQSMHVGISMPYLSDKPVGEDGFYMLTVAWNWARHGGPLYNFDKPASGIQPLATAVDAGLAWIVQHCGGGRWTFIRILLVFGVCNLIVLAHLLGAIARRIVKADDGLGSLAYLLGFTATICNFFLFRLFTYGLETGLYLTLLAACVLYTLRLSTKSSAGLWQGITFGCLAGLTGLARIDFGLILAALLAIAIVTRQLPRTFALAAGMVALAIVSPWLIWVHSVTGHFMPSSGRSQAEFITPQTALPRILAMADCLLQFGSPCMFIGAPRVRVLVALVASAALWVWTLGPRKTRQLVIADSWQGRICFNWLIAIAPLILIYPVFFWPTYFYGRYLSPLIVVLLPAMATLVARRLQALPRYYQSIAITVLPAFFFALAFLSLHSGAVADMNVFTADFVQREFPPGVRVGAFQSGVVGYFNPNVVNLDGKIDSTSLDYARRGELDRYLDQQHIDVLADLPECINRDLKPAYLAREWEPFDKAIPNGGSICLVRKSAHLAHR